MDEGDSDDAILQWKNSVCNITTTIASEKRHSNQPLDQTRLSTEEPREVAPVFEEDWEDAMFSSTTPITSYVAKDVCTEMNLGTEDAPQIIRIYEKISDTEWKYWYNFFKRNIKVFAWTYKDLRGVPPEVCEHRIILEEGTMPVRQRQYRMNPQVFPLNQRRD